MFVFKVPVFVVVVVVTWFSLSTVYGATLHSPIQHPSPIVPAPNSEPIPEPIRRSSTFDHQPNHVSGGDGDGLNLKQNVFFADTFARMQNGAPNNGGPFMMASPSGGNSEDLSNNNPANMNAFYSAMLGHHNNHQPISSTSDHNNNDVFGSTLKKYNVKSFLLKKILGNSHDLDEDDGGFFSNKHLKRHGTAGMAAKVIGELIGIKIRESIEGIGKSVSEYAKDFTARNFVNIGQVFARMFKAQ